MSESVCRLSILPKCQLWLVWHAWAHHFRKWPTIFCSIGHFGPPILKKSEALWHSTTGPLRHSLWIKELYSVKLDFSQWYTIANTRFWANQSICKVWSCYVQPFRRRCIYKKVHYFTFDLDLRSWINTKNIAQYLSGLGGNAFTRNIWFDLDLGWVKVTWSIALYIVWPMYLQNLKLLRPMVKEMHYQKNTLFDLDPKVKGVKVSQNVAQYSRHHVTYAPAKFDVATSHG